MAAGRVYARVLVNMYDFGVTEVRAKRVRSMT